MKRILHWMTAVSFLGIVCSGMAQSIDPIADLQKQLLAQFPRTKVTADRTNVVTAGTIFVLQKDKLMVYPSSLPAAPINNYKNGKLSVGFGDALKVDLVDGASQPGGSSAIPKKTLVAGEKFWLVDARVQKDQVDLAVITEPYDDGRYWGIIKIPFAKGEPPTPEAMLRMVGEVVTVQPPDAPAQDVASASPPAGPAPAPAPAPAMAPIAPPPPPADTPPPAPKTIALGQTKDQVTANFGPPQKVVKLAAKEIDYYPDMKVTFVHEKVSDVE